MNEEELKSLLKDPKRILNVARVFHQLLHQLDKMEEEKMKPKPKGVQRTKLKDVVEAVCRDKDGNIKQQTTSL